MKYRIHFTANGTEDHIDIEKDTVEEIQLVVANFFSSRGLDPADAWSEEIK